MLRTHLRTLQLIVEERVGLENILDSIASPALDELEIEQATSHPHVIWTQDHLSNFLIGSCCTIQCIRLYNIVMTAGELIVCLQGLPLLGDLEVRDTWQVRVPQLTDSHVRDYIRSTGSVNSWSGKSGNNLCS